ncbi:MAG: dethiobiotin synthase, partial [Muribaculaceae bacterium]|nr:dethiobiotin synthase [Muribaculaceae bacterium]
MNHNSKVIFVSGIHTDAGKSYATGWLASQLMAQGRSVITQKFIQTGNNGLSEDIAVHRRLMGTELHDRDLDHTTAPLIFSYPCSPQLAAEIDGRQIDLAEVDRAP